MESDQVQRRGALAEALSFVPPMGGPPMTEIVESMPEDGYIRHRIEYHTSDGDKVPAFAFAPVGGGPHPGVLVFHQHASQWHFGKSEVAGLVGDRWQAFGPALARAGLVVLAPDSIAFEDRRHAVTGLEPHEDDWLQHYNEMAYRLLHGDTLMRKILSDAAEALSVLMSWDSVDDGLVGLLGHSLGGNTVLFHSAVDDRVRFAVASGAAGSFRTKIASRTGIEMSEILPGFLGRFDVEDLVRAMAPRPLLLMSAEADKYSQDAPDVVALASAAYAAEGSETALTSNHYSGGHQLDHNRFTAIMHWTIEATQRLA